MCEAITKHKTIVHVADIGGTRITVENMNSNFNKWTVWMGLNYEFSYVWTGNAWKEIPIIEPPYGAKKYDSVDEAVKAAKGLAKIVRKERSQCAKQ